MNPTNPTNPSNLKILHIIDSGGLYGAEMVLLNLAAEQQKIDLHPTIASIGERGIEEKPLETEAIKRGLDVVKFRMFPGPNFPGMWQVLRYAQKNAFDVLHSHGYKGDVAFGLIPKKLRKLPLVSTLHGWTSVNGLSKNAIYEWLQKKSLKRVDAVVLVNKAMLSNPKLKDLKGINFQVVNNGIPLDNPPAQQTQVTQQTRPTRNLDKTILNFCQPGHTIVSIGRLSREKGFDILLKSCSRLRQRGLDVKTVIIGEGYLRGELEGLIKTYELQGSVLLPGYCENASRYIPCFNVYAISSHTEGLPMTLLEAMAAGVPVVASSVGGIPSVLDNGRNGYLVPAGDTDALTETLFEVLTNKSEAKAKAQLAAKRVRKHYSSQTMAQKYLSIYGQLCECAYPISAESIPIC